MSDFRLQDEGSISILHPLTEDANQWIEDHLPEDALTWAGGIVIEWRYVEEIISGILSDGLEVE